MKSDPALVPATPGGLSVGSLSQANRRRKAFDAILTLEDPHARPGQKLRILPGGPMQLVLAFEDADREDYGFRTATPQQVEQAIAFGRTHAAASLLIHCRHGIGRSTACAIAILTDRLGPGSETQAIDAIIAQRAGLTITPNLITIAHADTLLGRGGALIEALATSEAGRPAALARRRDRHRLATEHPEYFAKRT